MNYWKECIECAFDEAGITATDEQIDIVAECVEGGHENYGMAHYDAIPHPLEAEIDTLKARVKQAESERDEANLNFKKNVAQRHRCEVSDVVLGENGDATIY